MYARNSGIGSAQARISDSVLDVLVAKPSLDRTGVVTGIRKCESTAMPEHVGMDLERHGGAATNPVE
jgi:hypothetical protein